MAVPETSFDIRASSDTITSLPREPRIPPWSLWDAFFWRDVPRWYELTYMSAGGVMCCAFTLQYMDRHKMEVFLPPRANALPTAMRRAYTQQLLVKASLVGVAGKTLGAAALAGTMFGGAYYLGQYRQHYDWKNFAASCAVAGLWPPLVYQLPWRAGLLFTSVMTCFGLCVGTATQFDEFRSYFWDEKRNFEGWWFGRYVNVKEQSARPGT